LNNRGVRFLSGFTIKSNRISVTYCVTFLPNGGTGTAPVMADMAAGGTFRLPANPFNWEGQPAAIMRPAARQSG